MNEQSEIVGEVPMPPPEYVQPEADAGEEMAAMTAMMAGVGGNRAQKRFNRYQKAQREGAVHAVYTRQRRKKAGRK